MRIAGPPSPERNQIFGDPAARLVIDAEGSDTGTPDIDFDKLPISCGRPDLRDLSSIESLVFFFNATQRFAGLQGGSQIQYSRFAEAARAWFANPAQQFHVRSNSTPASRKFCKTALAVLSYALKLSEAGNEKKM